ncbi:aspartyl protease family protein [Sessilibacter corallicola]|uniref:aspartyl protease family protein n=1 Tax=Sessilibacter corallicola TaxID=2904075 RepID=UPI001E480EA1|nr:aspartyl protease family protein [Sessilibacter corallicola]MCE2029495.1 aspartyl protease family protein [Sessilibacter corallicola]
MKHITVGFSVLMCLLMLVGCVSSDVKKLRASINNNTSEWSMHSRVTRIPFKNIDYKFVIPVSLNDGKEVGFVLDTGAASSALMESHQTIDLNLASRGQLTINGSGDGKGSQASFIHNVDIGAGDLVLKNKTIVNVTLAGMPFFESLDEVFFDGILGYDFFNYLVVEINHDQSTITLYDNDEFERISHNMLNQGWVKVPLDIVGGRTYVKSKVLLKGQNSPIELKLLLDTGSNSGLDLSPKSHDKIEFPETHYASESSGFNGNHEVKNGLVPYLDIGGFEVKDLVGSYTDFGVAPSDRNSGVHGAIGMKLFSKFNTVFNYQGGYMLIKPNDTFDTPITADRSGLGILVHKDGYIVKRIDEELSAQQPNLGLGDIILSFNNKPATPENMVSFRQLLSSWADTINICWMKELKRHCEDIALMDRL